jgi:dihydropteroate synthase
VPVLKRLKGNLGIPISVDTYKASVAEKALELGADIINDPSGLTFDPELARVASNANAGLILNHMRGTPDTWLKLPPLKNVIQTIAQELDAAVHRAVGTGLDRKRVVIDPGMGFGKRKEQNAEIVAFLEALMRLELPIMIGPSRKHFLAKESQDQTEFATAAAVTASILHGAHLVRVHDVAAMKVVAEIADDIVRAGIVHVPVDGEETGVFRVPRPAAEPERKAVRPPGPPRRDDSERRPVRPFRRPDGPPGSRPSGPPRGPRSPR